MRSSTAELTPTWPCMWLIDALRLCMEFTRCAEGLHCVLLSFCTLCRYSFKRKWQGAVFIEYKGRMARIRSQCSWEGAHTSPSRMRSTFC